MRRGVLLTCTITLSLLTTVAQQASIGEGEDWKVEFVDEVSGYRILETVQELEAFGTRDFHTEEADEAASLIRQWMEEIGLETSVQEFTADGVSVTNVIGALNGDNNESDLLLFGAHYDSRNRYAITVSEAENVSAPGADDNASGVGAMLEIARVLAGCERYVAPTRFVAFGAEERGFIDTDGLFGSKAYAETEAALGVEYEATFIMDMIGFRAGIENVMTVIHNTASAGLADSISSSVQAHDLDIQLNILSNESLRYSDHASFWNEGYPSVLVIEELAPTSAIPVNPYYHSEFDTASTLSVEQMEEVAAALLATSLNLTDEGEVSYSLPSSLVLVTVGVASAALVAIVVSRYRKGVKRE